MRRLTRSLKRRLALSLFSLALVLSLTVGQICPPRSAVAFQDRSGAAPETVPILTAQAPFASSAQEQVRRGVEQYEAGDFQEAIAFWKVALDAYADSGSLQERAIVSENLARAYRRLGDADAALPYWEQTAQIYLQLGDEQKLGRLLTEKAQTHTQLGQYRQAIGQLCGITQDSSELEDLGEPSDEATVQSCDPESAVGIARRASDAMGEAAALGSLGEVYRLQGSYDQAEEVLTASLALAETLDNSAAYTAAATNSLGRVYVQRSRISDRRAEDAQRRGDTDEFDRLQDVALAHNEKALDFFQRSLEAASNQPDQLRAILSLISAHHRAGQLSLAQARYDQAVALLDQLSPSRTKAYAIIELANLAPRTRSTDLPRTALSAASCLPNRMQMRPQVEALLMQAIVTAEQTGDYRAQSFAYGKLGHLYECDQDYSRALLFTKDAEWAADQDLKSQDSLYLWQWQSGRILKAQADADSAIAAYEAAVDTLEKIRSDILTADRDVQFDFRDAVEPVYRQLAELRLGQAPTSEMVSLEDDTIADNISAALTTIDSLKLAELQNYFGDECIILASVDVEEAEVAASASYANTGIFSTFITADRTAIVLTLPEGRRRVEWLNISQAALDDRVNSFRISLETSLYRLEGFDPAIAIELYDQLIRPFAQDLAESGVDTLVFVQDGIFRSIPMAALYDGENYLIQQYAIANTPSLSLTATSPRTRQRPRALALGLSKPTEVEGRSFAPLAGVDRELDQIKQQLPGSQSLLNEEFTRDRLRQELQENEYSIIHMATHGEFGAEPQNTFLVTGDEQKLTIGELEAALRQAGGTQQIDLLTLTACETAIGDTRATLGLAGVAVQAGARSAIASLWSIDDISTVIIVDEFYRALGDPNLTKAQALQAAQLAAIESDSNLAQPGFWAPFLLIGNWQ